MESTPISIFIHGSLPIPLRISATFEMSVARTVRTRFLEGLELHTSICPIDALYTLAVHTSVASAYTPLSHKDGPPGSPFDLGPSLPLHAMPTCLPV